MIERKAFLQVAKALVLGQRSGLTDPSASMKQGIIEELASVLGVERCVIFRIGKEEAEGQTREFCEIAAGVPKEEYRDLWSRSPLSDHPDVSGVVESGRVTVIRNPRGDERTAYFSGIIERKDITEIAYIPLLIEEDSRPAGVIVVDGVRGRKFSKDEIEFCAEAAELLGLLLGQERILLQRFRDTVINKVVPLGGFARRLQENLSTTLGYINIIQKEATEIDSALPKNFGGEL